MDRDLSSSPALCYEDWLPEWTQLTTRASTTPCIPNTACMISTPLNSSHWNRALATYPNRDLATFFLQGISQGFKVGFSYGSIHLKPSSLILRELAPILMSLMTICKQKSISIEFQDRSHHHHCPAVRSADLE